MVSKSVVLSLQFLKWKRKRCGTVSWLSLTVNSDLNHVNFNPYTPASYLSPRSRNENAKSQDPVAQFYPFHGLQYDALNRSDSHLRSRSINSRRSAKLVRSVNHVFCACTLAFHGSFSVEKRLDVRVDRSKIFPVQSPLISQVIQYFIRF
jgi:hypothetical protein